jgi:hypothetical protein
MKATETKVEDFLSPRAVRSLQTTDVIIIIRLVKKEISAFRFLMIIRNRRIYLQ